MPATLSSLPTEVYFLIFEHIDSPRDLVSFSSSFRACRTAYEYDPARWELTAVKNGCPAELWYDFCAVQCAAEVLLEPVRSHEEIDRDRDSVLDFLRQYFANDLSHEIDERDGTAVHEAALMHDRIEWLMRDFVRSAHLEAQDLSSLLSRLNLQPATGVNRTRYAVRAHRLYRAYQPPQQLALTAAGDFINGSQDAVIAADFGLRPSERLRLYRGFLRHELCCRVFRSPQRVGEQRGVYSPRQYELYFLSRFLDWEVEEIACVHQFLRSIVQSAGNHLDGEFEEAVLWFHDHRRELQPDGRFFLLNRLSGSAFHLHSSPYRSHVGYYSEGGIIGAGLDYMRRFARADAAGKDSLLRDQIISFDHIGLGLHRVSGPSVSSVSPQVTPPQWPDDARRSQLHGPSAIYRSSLSTWIVQSRASIPHDEYLIPHRAIGCVFWDDWRFRETGLFKDVVLRLHILDNALEPGWGCSRYTRARSLSSEQLIGHLKVPVNALPQLIDLHGIRTPYFHRLMDEGPDSES
ncbi:hypothetical protein ISF_00116 [Cordyceps fumosorosea ARSEF 2679]|uniref:F-box domain-containing protein n=1 Tax=Cordyceps fumosorosea (strain ARSEF 2679) TaxID=1081104 RepID=A0A168E051_CORFA|nr:hypothetical protein ISF_00116 [Cordyceps fumosorosea ARSEF 2679]OAA73215.1 hypothetical protein ISF_00116 [Cordyceps fumosorosea ARSEF 2679]